MAPGALWRWPPTRPSSTALASRPSISLHFTTGLVSPPHSHAPHTHTHTHTHTPTHTPPHTHTHTHTHTRRVRTHARTHARSDCLLTLVCLGRCRKPLMTIVDSGLVGSAEQDPVFYANCGTLQCDSIKTSKISPSATTQEYPHTRSSPVVLSCCCSPAVLVGRVVFTAAR